MSPSWMTPSIISRASSSSSPSRWPSVTTVRISSSNDSSSGSSWTRPARRCSSVSTNHCPQRQGRQQHAQQPPQGPGEVEERLRPQPGQRPGEPNFDEQQQQRPAGNARAQRPGRGRSGGRSGSPGRHWPRTAPRPPPAPSRPPAPPVRNRAGFVPAARASAAAGRPPRARVARIRSAARRADGRQAGRQEAGYRQPKQGVGTQGYFPPRPRRSAGGVSSSKRCSRPNWARQARSCRRMACRSSGLWSL